MNKLIYAAGILSFALISCEDVNDKIDGLDEVVNNNKLVTDNSVEYTLTASDYKTIGKLYKKVDDVDTTWFKTLSSTQAFESEEQAKKYLPSLFIASKWYTLDKGSSVNITCNIASDGINETVTSILAAQTADLSEEDYAAAGSSVEYLTPSTVSKVPSVISSKINSAKAGDYCVVSYKYSDTEPSSESVDNSKANWTNIELSGLPAGNGSYWDFSKVKATLPSEFAGKKISVGIHYKSTTSIAGTVELANLRIDDGVYTYPTVFAYNSKSKTYRVSSSKITAGEILVLANYNGNNYVLDKISDSKGKGYGYSDKTTVAVSDGVISADDFNANKLTLVEVDGGFTVMNTDGKYLGCTGYNSFQYVDALPTDNAGYVWSFSNIGGTIAMTNVAYGYKVAFTSSYSTFGQYPDSKVTSYYENTLCGSSLPSGYTVSDVELNGLSSVWTPGNYYLKASGYDSSSKANLATESWLVSPEIDLSNVNSATISFDMAARFFTDGDIANYFQICVKEYAAEEAPDTKYEIYTYDGSEWTVASDVIMINPSDYKVMGSSYTSFGSSFSAETYLPIYLASNKPYAQEGDTQIVAYHYYDSSAKTTTVKAVEYQYVGGVWSPIDNAKQVVSERFSYSADGWVWNPSVNISLPADKSNTFVANFYQTVVDWVWTNIDKNELGLESYGKGYVSSYGNNEYYTGCSAYQNDVDWTAAKATSQYSEGFKGMSDDEIVATKQDNFKKVVGIALGTLYPDAEPVDGVDVIYTIDFVVYTGSKKNYTIQYLVTAIGTFEYIEGSLQLVE